MPPLRHRVLAEFLGTALLLAVVIGSGIMGERLSPANPAVALLANALATVGGLYLLIEILGPVSGAHFNPLVTATLVWRRTLPSRDAAPYVLVQLLGAVAGAWLAHLMFGLDAIQVSHKARTGLGLALGEIVATSGLIAVILRAPASKGSVWVSVYIGVAYWFTSSTSFANPAAVLGRALSDTFAGIAPHSAPAFVLSEVVGAALSATLLGVRAYAQGGRGEVDDGGAG